MKEAEEFIAEKEHIRDQFKLCGLVP